jgi:hypothetical protein
VWFVASGKRYDYEGVPPEVHAAFRNAFAKGRFFNYHIREPFPLPSDLGRLAEIA